MSTTDDRARHALRTIAHDAAAEADTERALAAVTKARRRIPTSVWVGLAAAAAVGVVTVVAWPDDRDRVVVDDVTSTVGTAPGPATTAVAATTTPTTAAPPTTQAATTVPTSVVPPGDPLAPGVVEFTGIGQLRLDRPLTDFPGWSSSFDLGPACGNLSPNDTTWEVAQARVTDDGSGALRIDAVYTYDPRFRTAEGLGVGSTISELRATYGDRLREAKPEFLPDGRPAISDPPYAHYAPIASVFEGDHAITFWLSGLDGAPGGEVVSAVKVSHLDFAGDDEGCA
jgi:hypothetical protein